MKKIILLALTWPLISYPLLAQKTQKEKTKNSSGDIIIIKNAGKEKKLTIETKDGEVFINGKPSSEYKGDDVSVIKQRFNSNQNFLYTPKGENFRMMDNKWGENRAFLGVTTEKTDDGLKITDVSKGSAAEKAGLKAGDIITKVGKKNVADPDELSDAVIAHKPKEDVIISYKRDGKAGDVKATLGESGLARSFSYNGTRIGERDFYFSNPKISTIQHEPFSMAWGFGRGRLGVRIEDMEDESGAKITEVHDESVAAKAGLKENDIITELNGKKVKDVNEVRKELAEVKEKSSYTIKAKRNGSEMNFEIKIPKKINKADL